MKKNDFRAPSRGFAVGGEFKPSPGRKRKDLSHREKHCICPRCGEKALLVSGTPCGSVACPRCGAPMDGGEGA